MSKLTKRERLAIINIVEAAIIAQGKPSIQPATKFCMYRDPNGNACAIGQLISDDNYDPQIDQVGGLEPALKLTGIPFDFDDQHWFSGLQSTHDSAARLPDEFVAEFQRRIDQFRTYTKTKNVY
jgi:hypothetical protein